jgi:uncharacterized protein involved in exopolysaccharide biosynthesis
LQQKPGIRPLTTLDTAGGDMRDWIPRWMFMAALSITLSAVPASAQDAGARDTTLAARLRQSEQQLQALRYRFTETAPEVQTAAAEVRRLRAELPPASRPTGTSLMTDSTYAAQSGFLYGLRYRFTDGDSVIVAAEQRLAATRTRLCTADPARAGCAEAGPR